MKEERRVEEAQLRRALRLDADERPPRLDLAAIRAAATRPAPPSPALRYGTVAAFAILALAAVVAAIRLAGDLVALALTGLALDAALAAVRVLAAPLETALAIVTHPSTPLAIVAALVVAAYHQRQMQLGRVE